MLPVPFAGFSKALIQWDTRVVTEVLPRRVNLERAVLNKPVDASTEERGIRLKRFPEKFACERRDPNGGIWHVCEFYVLANCSSDPVHQFLDGNAVFIRYQVRVASRLIAFDGLLHRVCQMLDVTGMIMCRAVANHEESSFGSSFVKHDEPFGIARTEDSGWTNDGDPHALF